MDAGLVGVYIAGATFAMGVIAYAVKVTGHIDNIEKRLREDFDAQMENLQRDINKLESMGMKRTESLRHETGEMGAAIRQKIHEVEVFSRDNFVRKDSFEQAVTRLENSFEKAMDKLENKIENAIERVRNDK